MAAPALHSSDARPQASADHVTPYDRLVWSDEEAEQLLASGEQRQELEAFFGAAEYRELVTLARAATRAKLRADAHRAIIVPGIMGSLLAVPRREPLPRDVLWIDPVDIGYGRLTELVLPGSTRFEPCGIVLYSYLRLRLHLRAAGHVAVFHPFDWRRGVDDLGHDLAQRLVAEPPGRIALVGHSLGGLVCRAALALTGGKRVSRVILLGAPNGGSFAAVQALRGTYAVVRKIARLDSRHSCAALAAHIFNTFPSLYHMLPRRGSARVPDLLDPQAWPRSGPRPMPELLESARRVTERLAPADERFAVILGVGRETVTAVARRRDEFVYTVTRLGDGTVPAACARLEGARHYHARVSHSELTRDPVIARAVSDLLSGGGTRRLPPVWRTASRAEARIGDHELSRLPAPKVDWARLTPEERHAFLQELNEPPKLSLRVPAHARRG